MSANKKARDGTRTCGLDLGKVAFRQLSHSREVAEAKSVDSLPLFHYKTLKEGAVLNIDVSTLKMLIVPSR